MFCNQCVINIVYVLICLILMFGGIKCKHNMWQMKINSIRGYTLRLHSVKRGMIIPLVKEHGLLLLPVII